MASRKTLSPELSKISQGDDFSELIALASQKMEISELNALIYGYISGKEAGFAGLESFSIQSKAVDDTQRQLADDLLEEFRPRVGNAKPLAVERVVEAAEVEASLQGSPQFHADATAYITQSIFAVFSFQGIPITMGTVPSAIMSSGKWTSTGRDIFARIAQRYPQFAAHAAPSSLLRFYDKALIELAKAIRSVL